jgi:uncharacterized protein
MAHIEIHAEDIELDSPTLVDGLPGIGLVGKIAADHLVDALDMTYYGACHCEGLAEVAVYHEDDPAVKPPVRLYADEATDLLVLQSDIPVSPSGASEFAGCLTGWLAEQDVTCLYLSGLPVEQKADVPALYGVATESARDVLAAHEIPVPSDSGVVSGPTGALLHRANTAGLAAFGLVVEANQNFPDPEAARVLLREAIEPIAEVSVETETLVEQAEEISAARERLAKRMQQADEESTQAQPLGMYQ